MAGYNKGDTVKWKWGDGFARGKVSETFTDDVERTIKGTAVRREASQDCPAYLIEQDDGDRVLKSHSEVDRDS
ncbi:MAG: DUF2945 domain-containing protein [Gammaproteobacteria bacterium]|nr:DUF2945 domain-containing protein [Gammaproteobacteria bacterium]